MVAFNSALGDLAAATSATQAQLNWIVDGYTVVLACLLLPAGAIGDRHGRRSALLVGLAVFSAASAAPAILDSPSQIIVGRMLAGAGAAFVMPATLSLLSHAYPRGQRSTAIGVWAAVAGSAGVVGLVGSGVVLAIWDWKVICWALGSAGVLVFVAALTISPPPQCDAPAVDWWGAVLIACTVAAVVFGLLEAPTRGWASPVTIGCLAGEQWPPRFSPSPRRTDANRYWTRGGSRTRALRPVLSRSPHRSRRRSAFSTSACNTSS